MSFARYPAYKDSCVEWLGEVPGHWEVRPLKKLGKLITGLTPPTDNPDNYEDFDGLPWLRPEDINESGEPSLASKFLSQKGWDLTRKVPEHATLICCIGTIGKAGYLLDAASTNQQITAISFHYGSRYFYYAVSALKGAMECEATGNVVRILNSERLGSIFSTAPPRQEAMEIATFLDTETAKIDGLMAEQRALVALLKEKRQTVISHAVTKGLNRAAPMKDSGVAWLEEVPGHWTVCAIRRVVAKIEQGWSPECFSRPADDDEWGVLKAGCVNRGTYDQSDNKALPLELEPIPEYEVQVGDVLMSRASGSPELVGSTALVTSTRDKLMLSDKIFRFRFEKQMSASFFVAALNSRPLRCQIEQALSGGNGLANNLPQSSLLNFSLCVPPESEQKAIVEFLNHQTTQLDTLTQEAQTAIALLQERRTALISAAVTGKMDVRAA